MSAPDRPITVAVVNDYPVIIEGLARMLADDGRFELVELDSLVDPHAVVDLTLYDAFASQGRVERDAERLLRDPRNGRLVVYSWNVERAHVDDLIARGVHAYVSKSLDGAALAEALVRTHGGERVVETLEVPEGIVLEEWPGQEFGLTPREAEIIALITQGITNEQIAQQCFLSINSVKTYIRSAYRKMGVERRSQAVLWGVQHGMLPERERSAPDEDGRPIPFGTV